MIDIDEAWNLPDRSSITLQLIGMNDLWDIVFTQEASQECFCGLGITVPLEHEVEHGSVLVYRSPEPVANTIDAGTDLVQVPPGTLEGFPVAQFFSEEGSELDAPLAEGLVADLDAALVEQFLHVTVAEGEAVIQPNDMLDDRHRESVAVGLRAYPENVV